jgi:hypothetical protein
MKASQNITIVNGVSSDTLGRIELKQIFDEIKNPDSKDLKIIESRRKGEDVDKTNLRSYVFGALFKAKRRRKQDLLTGTGIAILDYDNLNKYNVDPRDFKHQLFDYYTFIIAAFISPSGDGVKFLVNIPVVDSAEDYTSHYNALFDDMSRYPGLDPSGKDITRLCFTSYDDEILYREDPILWDYKIELPQQKADNKPVEILNPTEDRKHIKNIMSKAFGQITEHPMHPSVMKMATAMGGYVKAGYYNEEEAIEMLEKLIDNNKAMDKKDTRKQNIADGIKYGFELGALYLEKEDNDNEDNEKLLLLLKERHFDYKSEFENEVSILDIKGEKALSLGNFSVITGKQEAGKGFTLSLLVNGFLNSKGIITSPYNKRKRVIHIDTEQSGGHAKRLINTVGKLDGNNNLIDGYWLRGIPPETIVKLTDILIKKHSEDACLFIIDGIRDLSDKGVNDQEVSTMLFVKLMDWTQKHNIHIITVIHQNKQDGNATGFLGGDMVKKAELTLAIKKNKKEKTHLIEAEDTRDAPLDDIHFMIDSEVKPIIIDAPIAPNRKKDPEDYEMSTHKSTVLNVFKNAKALTSSELVDKIKYNLNNGDSKAKRFKEHWLENNLIKDIGNASKRQYVLYEDSEINF